MLTYGTWVVHTRDMNTTQTITRTGYLTCGKSWMGAHVRCLEGFNAGRIGTVIKVNKRSIRVLLDDSFTTIIGHAIYFEAIR